MSRYQQIATSLREAIRRGVYAVGEQLPSELELCSQYQVSRFTLREALRLLCEAELISRHRRRGTKVIARVPPPKYDFYGSSLGGALAGLADDSCVTLLRRKRITCNSSLGALLECGTGHEWIQIDAIGTRRGTVNPSCVSTCYIDPHSVPCDVTLRRPGALLLGEGLFSACVARVEQEFVGILLAGHEARRLRTKMGAPAILVMQRCYGRDGNLIRFSRTIHPHDRFRSEVCFIRAASMP